MSPEIGQLPLTFATVPSQETSTEFGVTLENLLAPHDELNCLIRFTSCRLFPSFANGVCCWNY